MGAEEGSVAEEVAFTVVAAASVGEGFTEAAMEVGSMAVATVALTAADTEAPKAVGSKAVGIQAGDQRAMGVAPMVEA